MEDEGRPLGIGLQDQTPNRLALLGDKIPGGERTRKRRGKTSSGEDQEALRGHFYLKFL
jgi:hypothetical protein